MAYALDPSEATQKQVRRVARARLDVALGLLESVDGAEPRDIEKAIHGVRKRCKELRGLARLVRPSLGAEFAPANRLTRDAAKELSSIRDAHALLATFDVFAATAADQDRATLAAVRAPLADSASVASASIRADDPRIERAHRLLTKARDRVVRWDLPKGFEPLGAGLEQTYADGRRALRRARRTPTDERVHEWRKAVKNLWYQVRLVQAAAPSVLGPLVEQLHHLSEALGDDHDLAVLVAQLQPDREPFGRDTAVERVVELAREQQDQLRRPAFRLGATLYAEPSGRFVDRVEAYWALAVRRGPELRTGGIAAVAEDAAWP